MDRKTFGIGILSITALVLLVANFLPKSPVGASTAVSGRDYQAVTARSKQGGETLYIVDNKTGLMGVFTYDVSRRTVVPRGVKPMSDCFQRR